MTGVPTCVVPVAALPLFKTRQRYLPCRLPPPPGSRRSPRRCLAARLGGLTQTFHNPTMSAAPNQIEILQRLLQADDERMRILRHVSYLALPDCWVGAGFVRSLVWDHGHGLKPRSGEQTAELQAPMRNPYA